MCSYADEREQRSILITFSAVSIGTTKISLPFEMFTRLLQLLSGKSAIASPLRLFSSGDHTCDTTSTSIRNTALDRLANARIRARTSSGPQHGENIIANVGPRRAAAPGVAGALSLRDRQGREENRERNALRRKHRAAR